MGIQHKNLAGGRWYDFNLMEQMANIGSEIERAIKWKNKNNLDYSQRAFERGLELLDLSISDKKNKNRLKELLYLREMMSDYFFFKNEYKTNDESWQKYFYAFNYAARKNGFLFVMPNSFRHPVDMGRDPETSSG